MTDHDQPASSLANLLSTFGVLSVIAVDDCDRDSTLDSELRASKLERGEIPLEGVLGLEGVAELIDDRGIDQDNEEAIRELIADGLRNGEISLGPPTSEDETASAFAILQSLLDEAKVPFVIRHFSDWEGPTSVDPTTLVLFDFRHGSEPEGVPLAIAYVAAHGENARVAIFSQEPGEAQELWAEHIAEMDRTMARQIVWIPKAGLTTEPSAIVGQLTVALSSPLLRRVREDGVELLRSAIEETAATAADLNPYELHKLTIGSADDGGFEPESLISRFARRSLPAAMATMQLQAPVHSAIRKLRQVDDARGVSPDPTGKLIDLQRDDYYISRKHLVGRHQAAVAGDIFARIKPEVVSSVLAKTFEPGSDPLSETLSDASDLTLCVLVGQQCDLAVRPSGDRSMKGRWLEALPITFLDGDRDGAQMGPAIHNKQHVFRLPWLLGHGDGEHRRVTYKNVLSLPMLAVDACVWSSADAAALAMDAPASERLSLNWHKRYELLTEEIRRVEQACRVASTLDGDENAVAERIRLDAAASDDEIGFYYSADQRSMAWGLVRVARLRSPYVESLLTSYNDFRRRDAFPSALV